MNILLPILFSLSACYKYYTYQEIVNIFVELAQKHSDKFTLHYPLKNIQNTRELDCGSEECQFFYAEFVNQQVSNDLPTILILAGFHGDEVVGQNVVTELALYLSDDSRLQFLNYRRILLYPMANPYGYYHNVREEKGLDANRDFSIDNQRRICFQTNMARAIAQVYAKFIIQLGITFHGGDNSITYSWGTKNYEKNGKAFEAPDDNAFALIGRIMRDVAGQNNKLGVYTYSLGRMTDIVYPVNGGYEDWAYAAGWDQNSNCGNRDASEYIKGSQNARALTYLIEANDQKRPAENSLGSQEATSTLLENWPPLSYYNTRLLENFSDYGNINRNIIASLALIDLGYPYLTVQYKNNSFLFNFGGCYSGLMVIYDQNKTVVNKSKITGIWDPFNKGLQLILNQSQIYTIHYSCDLNFKKQNNPSPKVGPQSYFVQSRINSSFEYKLDDFSVRLANNISHTLNLTKIMESTNKTEYHINENLELGIKEKLTLEKQLEQPSQQKINYSPQIMLLLTVFVLLTLILLYLLYKFCQKKPSEEVIEMNTIQNEDKL